MSKHHGHNDQYLPCFAKLLLYFQNLRAKKKECVVTQSAILLASFPGSPHTNEKLKENTERDKFSVTGRLNISTWELTHG